MLRRAPFLIAAAVAFSFVSNTLMTSKGEELPPPVDRDVDFKKDVAPLFKKHCLKCHGPKKQEAGFRLDSKTAALNGGDNGESILPGNSEESLFIIYVSGIDENIVMPPEGDMLSKEEIGILRAWIDQGAEWPADAAAKTTGNDHWSYQPIVRHKAPAVRDKQWVRNAIDAFVLARLEQAKITPSPAADRYTLIRRLSLDLLGLPPTPEDVDSFVNDKSPKAYENLVDRLLKSPHFGERWGRHWLDLARYADSDGYEKDNTRPNAWRWRDWVIQAVNQDLPFDQFTIEQIAGDVLPNATDKQRLATAFHRQTLTNTEGGTDREQWRVEACFDRVETTGAVWLGLTVGCARCHSHKYDQISQREYYQLFAFVNNGDETNTTVPTSDEALARYQAELKAHTASLEELQTSLDAAKSKLGPELVAWEADYRKRVATAASTPIKYHPLEFTTIATTSKAKLTRQDDGSYLVEGPNADKDEYTLTAKVPALPVTGLKIETIPDDRLPNKGAGRADNGNFVLADVRVYFANHSPLKKEDKINLRGGKSDFAQDKFPATSSIDKDVVKTGWAVAPKMGLPHNAEWLTEKPLATEGEAWLQVVLDQQYGGKHTIGRFRLSVRTGVDPQDGIPANVLAILDVKREERKPEQQTALLSWFATIHETTKPLQVKIDELKKNVPKRPEMQVRVVTQRTSSPRKTYVFKRGDFLSPLTDREVIPAGLSTLPSVSYQNEKQPNRLDFANWLISKDNPLTPRVTVNHVWKHLFGEGIVRTVNDFGVRGEKPTHPELLDWLASEFRDTLGWSRKKLIRLIVTSATYRQASIHRDELFETDPQNLLLARQNRLRAEAEVIRDVSLSVSGLLSKKVGGPSVFPPLPPGVAELSYANNFKWKTSAGEDRYRRGMYTFFKRTAPHPNLVSFDCPDANTTCVQRQSSNTPLQALILLNNEVFVDSARSLARRVLKAEIPSDVEGLNHAFRLCVARPMTGAESGHFASLLRAARTYYGEHEEDAKKLVKESGLENKSIAEVAAWAATCRVMLNMDEFITRN